MDSIYNVSKWDVYSIKWHFSKCGVDEVKSAYFIEPSLNLAPGGGEVLPYMGYIGMCRCEGYGFQAVYSRIGYVNQSVWV